jgi:hypothetical protein
VKAVGGTAGAAFDTNNTRGNRERAPDRLGWRVRAEAASTGRCGGPGDGQALMAGRDAEAWSALGVESTPRR